MPLNALISHRVVCLGQSQQTDDNLGHAASDRVVRGGWTGHTCQLHSPGQPRGAAAPNLWPGGVALYSFSANVSAQNCLLARAAMNEIEAISAVRFVQRLNEPDYILIIQSSSVNESLVGERGASSP